jgi:Mg/Co/Ni transporter MgtE
MSKCIDKAVSRQQAPASSSLGYVVLYVCGRMLISVVCCLICYTVSLTLMANTIAAAPPSAVGICTPA